MAGFIEGYPELFNLDSEESSEEGSESEGSNGQDNSGNWFVVLDLVRETTGLNVNEILDQTVTWTLNWLGFAIESKKKQARELDKIYGRNRV